MSSSFSGGITVDSGAWETAIREYNTRLGYSFDVLLRDQTRNLAVQLMKVTPPYARAGGFGPDDLKAGTDSVKKNLRRAVIPLMAFEWKNPRLKDAARRVDMTGDYNKARKFVTRMKKMKHWRVEPFTPSLHRRQLDSRGRAHAGHTMTLDNKAWGSYLGKLLSHVGLAKSGWLHAFTACGGMLAKIPSWITRHAGRGPGRVQLFVWQKESPHVVLENWAIGIRFYEMAFRRALQRRAFAMNKDIERQLAKAAKEAGFSTRHIITNYRSVDGRYEVTN